MYKKVKTNDGMIICQAENHHITVRNHKKLIMHITCYEEKTINELIEMYHEMKEFIDEKRN